MFTIIWQVFLGVAQFVVVVLASVVIGFVVGMVAAFITRFSEHVHGKCCAGYCVWLIILSC